MVISTAIEDETGDAEALRIFHYDAGRMREILSESQNTIFAIKQPYLTFSKRGVTELRLDHPSDIVVLGSKHSLVPCLESLSKSEPSSVLTESDLGLQRDLYRNRAYVNQHLQQYDAAKFDALAAISGQSTDDEQLKKLDSKAYYRAGLAAYSLREFEQAEAFFGKEVQLAPKDADGIRELRRVTQRLAEQKGSLDLSTLSSCVTAQQPRLDVADFTCLVEVKDSPGRGHGMFATEDIESGKTFRYEKAFSAIWEHEEDMYLSMKYDPRRADKMWVSSQVTVEDVVKKLFRNPSLIPRVTSLYGDTKGIGSQILIIDAQPVIDTFQINDICSRNAFGFRFLMAPAQNVGLFACASMFNHSCLPNSEREHYGDVITFRVQKFIAKGEEIFIRYDETLSRWKITRTGCTIYSTGGASSVHANSARLVLESVDLRGRRNELAEQVEAFRADHITGNKREPLPMAVVKEAESLARELTATYDLVRYRGVPCLPLAMIQSWLISAYGTQRHKTYSTAIGVLKILACDVVEVPSLSVRATGVTEMTGEALVALSYLSSLELGDGERGLAKELEDMANDVHRFHGSKSTQLVTPAMMAM